MKNNSQSQNGTSSEASTNVSRRKFFGKLGTAAIGAAAVGSLGAEPFLGGKASVAEASHKNSDSPGRMNDSFNYHNNAAIAQRINVGIQEDNGDAARFTDFSGSFSKALLHDSLGVPNAAAWLSLRNAMRSGNQADFANILVGTPGGDGNSKLNGPQLALAFDLEGSDSHATIIPAAPSVASAQTAAEQVEHYWADKSARRTGRGRYE